MMLATMMMQTSHLQVSHFTAALTYAFFASVVFGITFRSAPRAMVRYGAYCFAWFMGGLFVAAWVMWLLNRLFFPHPERSEGALRPRRQSRENKSPLIVPSRL